MIICAVMGGNVRNTQRLIEFGADVSKTSFKNETAMHLAAKNGHTDVIKLLLEYNVNVNAFDRELRTPLMLAARGGNLEAMLSSYFVYCLHDSLTFKASIFLVLGKVSW